MKPEKTERKPAEKPAWSARSPGDGDFRRWKDALEEKDRAERKAGGTSEMGANEGLLPHREFRGRKSFGPFLEW